MHQRKCLTTNEGYATIPWVEKEKCRSSWSQSIQYPSQWRRRILIEISQMQIRIANSCDCIQGLLNISEMVYNHTILMIRNENDDNNISTHSVGIIRTLFTKIDVEVGQLCQNKKKNTFNCDA